MEGKLAKAIQKAELGAYFRPRDVAPFGVSLPALHRLVAHGQVERVSRGLYRLSEPQLSELETVAMVASAVPQGVICLLSALHIHSIGTQVPHEVWIAIDRKARPPTHPPARVRIVRFSKQMLHYGIVTRNMVGVPVQITSPARTVVDCFRYRNKIGLDVAVEALRDALKSRSTSIDEIWRAAEVCRARTVMEPYLEALAA